MEQLIKIALIGKPNVGKSSLFNRFAKQRDAIISEVAGTTRDIKKKVITIDNKEVLLLDTGGIEQTDEMLKNVRKKSLQIAKDADIVLFMVDGKLLPDEEDKKLFFELQKISKNIALVVNKIDNEKLKDNLFEYYSFGAKEIFDISVSHNIGISKLSKWISSFIPDKIETQEDFFEFLDENFNEDGELKEEDEIKVAILGRPNVGKSSLLNALVKEDRAVVSSIAGTTIDPVDESIEYKDKTITFVDTAGIRRRSKIEGIEKYAFLRNKDMLQSADIAILTLDCSEDFTELDERIAGLISDNHLGVIIVLNKYDIRNKDYKELVGEVKDRFKFLSYAPIISISAKSKQRVHKLNDLILKVYANYSKRISTSNINKIIELSTAKHHLPSDKGKTVKIYYSTQFDTKPPQIALISNRPASIHFSYLRYLENRFRENIDLEGTPIILLPKKRRNLS